MANIKLVKNLYLNGEAEPIAIISALASNVIMRNNKNVQETIGLLASLNTVNKNSLVEAINEVCEQATDNKTKIIGALNTFLNDSEQIGFNATFDEIVEKINQIVEKSQKMGGATAGLYDYTDYANIIISDYGQTVFQ
jgi:uncharacterized protein (DUF4213/DUF364 family)